MKRGVVVALLFVVLLSGSVLAADYKFQNDTTDLVTIDGNQGNVTSVAWFNGLFDWVIESDSISPNYLGFNGSDLSFNETYLNATIDNRIGEAGSLTSAGSIIDRATYWSTATALSSSQLNLSTATEGAQLTAGYNFTTLDGGYFKGLFNWVVNGSGASQLYLNFNGSTLTVNDSFFNDTYATLVGGNDFSGTQTFNGGFGSGGVTIQNGDIFAQQLFAYNISNVAISTLNINGSLTPAVGYNATFDIGNDSTRWRYGYFTGDLYINGTSVYAGLNGYNATYAAFNTTSNIQGLGFNTTQEIVAAFSGGWNSTYNVSYADKGNTSGEYLYNDSRTIFFNDTQLNNTIDARITGGVSTYWNNNSGIITPDSPNYAVAIGGDGQLDGAALTVNGTVVIANRTSGDSGQIYVDSNGDMVFRI